MMTALPIDATLYEHERSLPLAPVIQLRPVQPVEIRYEWTTRGLAVLVTLALSVLGVMAATMVGVFLSISDEPLPVAPVVHVASDDVTRA